MKTLFALVLIGLSFNSFGQNTSKQLKGIDKELQNVLETWKAAGFAVAVVKKNEVVYSQGFGYRDFENKVPVNPNTKFAIGSTTKAFTGAVLGVLRNENKLSFSDKPADYIPGFKFFNSDMDNLVTIKDIMCHQTGLPRHDLAWYFFPTNSKDSLLSRVRFHEPTYGVREQWQYNNFMYLAQGVIAEKITGKTWEENIESMFLKPLGMENTSVDISGLQNGKNASFGYGLEDDKIVKLDYYDIAGMSPAGSMNSSVNDMSKWLKVWINSGKYEGKEIIPSQYVNDAISSQAIVGSGLPGADHSDLFMSNYGYGWMTSSYKGHYRVEHGGNIDGFTASVSFFPSDSIGIVVLANQNGSSIPSVVRNIIADRLLGVDKTDWNKDLYQTYTDGLEAAKNIESESTQKTGTSPSHNLKDYSGKYTNEGYGSMQITLENDTLFLNLPREKFWLSHYHYDVFTPIELGEELDDGTPLLFVNFTTNDLGEISSARMMLQAGLDAIEFKNTPAEVKIDASSLDRFVGEYTLGGATVKVYTKGGDVLYLFVPGQPEYELYATGENTFSLKIIEGYNLEFNDGADGKVEELVFIQPNGTFKAKRK
jgi:CubicO group peptidase (beta-lactamase class C family)